MQSIGQSLPEIEREWGNVQKGICPKGEKSATSLNYSCTKPKYILGRNMYQEQYCREPSHFVCTLCKCTVMVVYVDTVKQ